MKALKRAVLAAVVLAVCSAAAQGDVLQEAPFRIFHAPGERALGRHHTLRPYLILVAVLAIALALFAALASRYRGREPEPQSSRPSAAWEAHRHA